MTRILCVCYGNTCRSPMFAAKLKVYFKYHGREVEIESAGTNEPSKGQPAAPDWELLSEETRVDLSGHASRYFGDLDLSLFDLIYCMDKATFKTVLDRVMGLLGTDVQLVNSPDGIPNPWQKGLDAYRDCYHTICEVIEREVPPNR